jgi:hypothetical protein
MNMTQLAQELRERQYKLGTVPREMIDALTDVAIIDSYITCSCCGAKQVNEAQLHVAISSAENADHFFQICDEMSVLHKDNSEN